MGKLHTLVARATAPARSPEREALAALIEKQGVRTAALNAALAAEARASARVDEAERTHEAAERALEAAKAADAPGPYRPRRERAPMRPLPGARGNCGPMCRTRRTPLRRRDRCT